MQEDITNWRIADLFCGIGGFRLGFRKAGFNNFVYSNDCDKWCQLTYDKNYGEGALDCRPIEDVSSNEIPEIDILLAGFPCQPFSIAGKKNGFDDRRGHAFFELARIIKDKTPRVVVLENVKHIISHDKKKTFETIRHILENDLGYHMYYQVLNARDFGVPQDRKRVYMVGFKDPINFSFPKPIQLTKTIKDILDKQADDDCFLSQKYLEGLEKHKERHALKGNGFGYEILDNTGIAHALVVGNMGRERNLIQDLPRPGFYKDGDDRALKKNNRGVRKVTARECARLQGFPDSFQIPVPRSKAYSQFGNAVAVPVIRAIAKQIKKALENQDPDLST